jgi:CspA family cold shock protein
MSASFVASLPANARPDDTLGQLQKYQRQSVRIDMVSVRNRCFEENQMAIGTVKFFNTGKGFGFISPEGGGKDVFVHASAVEAAGMRSLNEGQRVEFDIQPDARGSKATNLRAA